MYAELMGNHKKQRIKSLCDNILNLLEGRQYYDCFVFGQKAGGIYVHVNTSNGNGTVLAAPTVAISANKATVTVTSGCTGVYTIDGSDPRYSSTAKTYTAAVDLTSGQKIRVYQYLTAGTAGTYPSVIAESVNS